MFGAFTENDVELLDPAERGTLALVYEKPIGLRKPGPKAEFIVRAVNSHEALLEAVKDLRQAFYIDGTPKAVKAAFSKHADKLREIIAQAEGAVRS